MADSSPYFNEDHEIFRHSVRSFVEKEMAPHTDQWEREGIFPRELFTRVGELGFLGVRHAVEYGGSGLDFLYTTILCEELVQCGSIGTAVNLLVQTELAPSVITALGTEEQKRRYLPDAITGSKIFALGISEPSAGSDVAALRTTARRDGEDYVIDGSKIFITNGTRADFISLAVRTGGEGAGGVSMLVFPTDTPGFSVGRKLEKMGNHAGDTAELFFDGCRVPRANLLGAEGSGFRAIMHLFQGERLVLSALACGVMTQLYSLAYEYGSGRSIFGKPIIDFQIWRHRLADVDALIEASRQLTYSAAHLLSKGERADREVSIAKLFTADAVKRVANEALQIHGGYGYMEDYLVCRLYRDVAAFTIGAGSSEVMREILAKQAAAR
ncbi:MAG: acyl-CoA dehydrogenase family protein [Candidatus Binatia bacterium]